MEVIALNFKESHNADDLFLARFAPRAIRTILCPPIGIHLSNLYLHVLKLIAPENEKQLACPKKKVKKKIDGPMTSPKKDVTSSSRFHTTYAGQSTQCKEKDELSMLKDEIAILRSTVISEASQAQEGKPLLEATLIDLTTFYKKKTLHAGKDDMSTGKKKCVVMDQSESYKKFTNSDGIIVGHFRLQDEGVRLQMFKMLVPVSLKDRLGHWLLANIKLKSRTVDLWDSMAIAQHKVSLVDIDILFLFDIKMGMPGELKFLNFKIRLLSKVLQQSNETDCGLFMLNKIGSQCIRDCDAHFDKVADKVKMSKWEDEVSMSRGPRRSPSKSPVDPRFATKKKRKLKICSLVHPQLTTRNAKRR
ncbi:Ulp1 protease family, C-terminal catalytic domain containing protein [Parasponia andersonii]|uniref:Ulp1 protease family, C-terminal catalytic domain containing protein n=1 Tax=Parasponia andersonii TaxID=3476 RepID=A0A2P5DXZ4_PARAD|nr:Ulp1 protease family, C-terminal catalytic domain containing protein [Parasponia andersonii]